MGLGGRSDGTEALGLFIDNNRFNAVLRRSFATTAAWDFF
jgi:hypothetical protein